MASGYPHHYQQEQQQKGNDLTKDLNVLNLTDSFFNESSQMNEEEFLHQMDKRINSKLAVGMKKVVKLIINQVSTVMEQHQEAITDSLQCQCKGNQMCMRSIANEEINARLKEITESLGTFEKKKGGPSVRASGGTESRFKKQENYKKQTDFDGRQTGEVVKVNLSGIAKRKTDTQLRSNNQNSNNQTANNRQTQGVNISPDKRVLQTQVASQKRLRFTPFNSQKATNQQQSDLQKQSILSSNRHQNTEKKGNQTKKLNYAEQISKRLNDNQTPKKNRNQVTQADNQVGLRNISQDSPQSNLSRKQVSIREETPNGIHTRKRSNSGTFIKKHNFYSPESHEKKYLAHCNTHREITKITFMDSNQTTSTTTRSPVITQSNYQNKSPRCKSNFRKSPERITFGPGESLARMKNNNQDINIASKFQGFDTIKSGQDDEQQPFDQESLNYRRPMTSRNLKPVQTNNCRPLNEKKKVYSRVRKEIMNTQRIIGSNSTSLLVKKPLKDENQNKNIAAPGSPQKITELKSVLKKKEEKSDVQIQQYYACPIENSLNLRLKNSKESLNNFTDPCICVNNSDNGELDNQCFHLRMKTPEISLVYDHTQNQTGVEQQLDNYRKENRKLMEAFEQNRLNGAASLQQMNQDLNYLESQFGSSQINDTHDFKDNMSLTKMNQELEKKELTPQRSEPLLKNKDQPEENRGIGQQHHLASYYDQTISGGDQPPYVPTPHEELLKSQYYQPLQKCQSMEERKFSPSQSVEQIVEPLKNADINEEAGIVPPQNKLTAHNNFSQDAYIHILEQQASKIEQGQPSYDQTEEQQFESLHRKLFNEGNNTQETSENNLIMNSSESQVERNFILDHLEEQSQTNLSQSQSMEKYIQPYVKKGENPSLKMNLKNFRPVSFDQSYELEDQQQKLYLAALSGNSGNSGNQNGTLPYRLNSMFPNFNEEKSIQNHYSQNNEQQMTGAPQVSILSTSFPTSVQEQIQKLDDSNDIFGLNKFEQQVFGDRTPKGHKKIKILSKCHTQLYWLSQLVTSKNKSAGFHMELQIPKQLENSKDKFNLLAREQMFFEMMKDNKQIQQFIFNYEGIINKQDIEDVWSIYKIEDDGSDRSTLTSLHDDLFRITLHSSPQPSDNFYCVAHAHMYQRLSEQRGVRHLARLTQLLCQFLEQLDKAGLNYSNLRAENVILQWSEDGQLIEGIKLINYGYTLKIGQKERLIQPEQVDHLPVEELLRLSEAIQLDSSLDQSSLNVSTSVLELSQEMPQLSPLPKGYDMFSLGILLLEIIIGCPTQVQLPIKIRCKTVDGQAFTDTPVFGLTPQLGELDQQHITNLMQTQKARLNNLQTFLTLHDHYKLTSSDADLMSLMEILLNPNPNLRPTASEIMRHAFVLKWAE